MFRVTQHIDFCYGHRLLNYDGKCRNLHGHNGRAVVVLEREQLDERGMIVDFSEIKKSLRGWIDQHLDHRMILCENDPVLSSLQMLNEPIYVIPVNPTAENIAKLIFDYAKSQGFPVKEVTVWETTDSHATYRE